MSGTARSGVDDGDDDSGGPDGGDASGSGGHPSKDGCIDGGDEDRNFSPAQSIRKCPACKHVQKERPLKCKNLALILRKSENMPVPTREKKKIKSEAVEKADRMLLFLCPIRTRRATF